MREAFTDRLISGQPLLFDGALGSRLIHMGLPAGMPPEAWVLQYPEKLVEVHREYAQAGAEVLTTCTFGANRLRLTKASLTEQIVEINKRAVELVRQTAGDDVYIAGDMGPTGEFLQPHGSLTSETATEVFAEQAQVLAASDIDFFLLETHYSLPEALININACHQVAPKIPVAATLTFNRTKKGFFTVMGEEAASVLQALGEAGAVLVGANCTLEAEGMLELAKYLTSKLSLPLLFQPNAGSPQITSEGIVYPQSVSAFADYMEQMIPLGVRALGGCCGTDAAYIKALRKLI